MKKRVKPYTKVCQATNPVEFNTPNGGTLIYGPCQHGFFVAMLHCPVSDVRTMATSLLEATDRMSGQHGKDASKASKE